MKINEIITEVFNPETSFPIEWDDHFGPKEMHGRAYDRQGGYIDIKFVPLSDNTTEVEFSRNDSYDVTGGGDANRVLGTILEAFREYLRGHQPKIFVFSAKGGSRSKVYQSMINRFAQSVGYKQFDTSKLSPEKRAKLAASGTDLMVLRRAAVAEAFDQPYKSKWAKGEFGDYDILVKLPDGSPLSITFNHEGDNEWHVAFERGHSQDITGEGDAQRIFATVLATIQKFIKKHKPQQLTFSATKDVEPDQNSESRAKLYNRLVDRYATSWGYDALIDDLGDQVEYELTRLKPGVAEEIQGIAEGDNNDTAISLSKLGKFHPGADTLAEFVPERATAQYALHPDKWESTFYSLTNKDSDKLKYYGPKKISIPPGTLVGDMAIANKFYRAKTSEEKQQYAELYRQSLKPYPVDVSAYRMPELLIPRQGVAEDAVKDLEKDLKEPHSYDAIDHMMKTIAREEGITTKVLHDRFVDKHGMTPDDWIKNKLSENFADGKVKGKSRPGRVKRAGASCNGSVTDLRARAKNASGEKAKMYHWCANMKSGRKK